ncbi:MAG TPA: ATP-binding protein [Frankiaceae bacterium]|nr:ATP-binding protein [Frankiaceae bacterium]
MTIERMPGPEVVLMCGIAGSGKTTYSRRLEEAGYIRLSIDEAVWAQFGRYGLDYAAADYGDKSRLADGALRQRVRFLIRQGNRVVVDNSFWSRAIRDEYKELVTASGGQWRLVYLQATPERLRRRLEDRAQRFDANAAFPHHRRAARRLHQRLRRAAWRGRNNDSYRRRRRGHRIDHRGTVEG